MVTPVRFVVIGFGNIGKRHVEEIMAHKEAELVAIVDIDPQKETEVVKLGVPFFNTPEAFYLSSLEVDVVNVCTPNGFHAAQSLQALNFYLDVVCEKPMGLNAANCQQVIDMATEVERNVYCVMQNRYSPPSEWLKELVCSGKLGNIYTVKVDCYWNRDHRYYKPGGWHGTLELDGGPLYTQFSHFVDLLYWLFGDVSDIEARFENYSHQHNTQFEDTGYVTFKLENGALGAFNYSTSAYNKNLESSITILAEKGTVKVSGQYMSEVVHCEVEGYTMPELPPSNPPNKYAGYEGSASNHFTFINEVVKHQKGLSASIATAEEGKAVVDIIERIYALRNK